MLKKLSLIKWLILAGLLVVVIVLVLQRDRVYDYYRGITYKPSAEMVKIRDSLDLTSEGEFIFNASQPALSERDEFNQNCRPTDAETAILGCYVMENIYVYNIEDEQLKGIKELTAAHELLHAVYARMSDEKTERRCKSCSKLLLDEKLPFCHRCILEGRNKAGQIGGLVGGIATTIASAWAMIKSNDQNTQNTDDSSDDEEEV